MLRILIIKGDLNNERLASEKKRAKEYKNSINTQQPWIKGCQKEKPLPRAEIQTLLKIQVWLTEWQRTVHRWILLEICILECRGKLFTGRCLAENILLQNWLYEKGNTGGICCLLVLQTNVQHRSQALNGPRLLQSLSNKPPELRTKAFFLLQYLFSALR